MNDKTIIEDDSEVLIPPQTIIKKKVALYKNVKYNYESIKVIKSKYDLDYWLKDGDVVMLSEVIEVDFPELDSIEVINSQVAIIEKQIVKVNADAQAAVTALEGRKQELLAITHKVEK